MNIALIGYGKMGMIIEQTAHEQGHTVAAIVDPEMRRPSSEGPRVYTDISGADLAAVDVAIEFTRPGAAAANIKALAERKIPVVSGTTGWYDQMDEVRQAVDAAESALVWSSNFSIGVNLFYRIVWYASELADRFPEFDVGGLEIHHNKKHDSPSGTAKTLAEGMLSRIGRKQTVVWETLNRRPAPDELHYSSLRLGSTPGRHAVYFDSSEDTIEISHTARNREGFASGALRAAQWLVSPGPRGRRRGVFTIDEMLNDMLGTGAD